MLLARLWARQYFHLRDGELTLGCGTYPLTPVFCFMKVLASVLAVSALIFTASSCAKHDWEKTKVLHEGSSDGHDAHGDGHGAAEAKDAHGGEVHAAKPAEGAHTPAEKKH